MIRWLCITYYRLQLQNIENIGCTGIVCILYKNEWCIYELQTMGIQIKMQKDKNIKQ